MRSKFEKLYKKLDGGCYKWFLAYAGVYAASGKSYATNGRSGMDVARSDATAKEKELLAEGWAG